MSVQEQIRQIVTEHPVVLFMKGTPTFPQCGFSSGAVQKALFIKSPAAGRAWHGGKAGRQRC